MMIKEQQKNDYFVRRLSLPGLRQKLHQFLIENPPATWQQSKDLIATKDLRFAVSSELTGTASSIIDYSLELLEMESQLNELAGLMNDHKKTHLILP